MKFILVGVNVKKNYEDLVSITLPALTGEIEILENHAETFARLVKGGAILKSNKSTTQEEIPYNCLCYIKDNLVTVIT